MGASTVQQLAEKIGPQGMYELLIPHIRTLKPPTGGRTQVKARCPHADRHQHDDRKPSWSWNLARGISHCFACDYKPGFVKFLAEQTKRSPREVIFQLAKRYNVPLSSRPALTLAEYAQAKHLPAEFLQDRFRLTNDPERGLVLPYLDAKGCAVSQGGKPVVRNRRSMTQKPLWPKGVKARQLVYGLHRPDRGWT